jgi:hypothetical protein
MAAGDKLRDQARDRIHVARQRHHSDQGLHTLIIDLGPTTVHGLAVVSSCGAGHWGQDQAAGESFPFLGTTSVVVGHRRGGTDRSLMIGTGNPERA